MLTWADEGVQKAAGAGARLRRVCVCVCVCVSVLYLPGLSLYFDCFDSILEWDGMSGMEVVFDSLIVLAVLIRADAS